MSAIRDRAAVAVVLLAALLVPQVSKCQSQAPTGSMAKITVKISTDKKRIRPAEDVVLHVEIWNEGLKDLFIFKEFSDPDNPLRHLDTRLHYGDKIETPAYKEKLTDAVPFSVAGGSPLASALSIGCVALAPGHFYGGEVVMSATLFDRLRVPGKYRIQGKYWSRGFMAQNMNNPLLDYIEELKKLPYPSWAGEVETNSICIEVAKPLQKH